MKAWKWNKEGEYVEVSIPDNLTFGTFQTDVDFNLIANVGEPAAGMMTIWRAEATSVPYPYMVTVSLSCRGENAILFGRFPDMMEFLNSHQPFIELLQGLWLAPAEVNSPNPAEQPGRATC